MADSIQPNSFSGMAMPPGNPEPEAKPPELEFKKLKPGDGKKLGKLLEEERLATLAYEKAVKRRNLFCLDLEKEYALLGKTWKVNFERGVIEIIGDRDADDSLPDLRGKV